MKRLLIGVACLMLLAAAMPAMAAWPDDPLIGNYNIFGADGSIMAEIQEKVYPIDQTFDLTGFADAYLYSYTVTNDRFASVGIDDDGDGSFDRYSEGIWCFGFMNDPSTWGARVYGWAGPDGWTPTETSAGKWLQNGRWWTLDSYDCGCLAGTQAGWINPDAGGVGSIAEGDSLDTFWLVSPNEPHKMVDAFVHGANPNNLCTGTTYAYGQISAPTPEPVSAVLLLLGLPAAAALRKRRE